MPDLHPTKPHRFYLTQEESELFHALIDRNYRRVAPMLNISDSALYKKLHGKSSMTLRELEIVCHENGITPRQVILANQE